MREWCRTGVDGTKGGKRLTRGALSAHNRPALRADGEGRDLTRPFLRAKGNAEGVLNIKFGALRVAKLEWNVLFIPLKLCWPLPGIFF